MHSRKHPNRVLLSGVVYCTQSRTLTPCTPTRHCPPRPSGPRTTVLPRVTKLERPVVPKVLDVPGWAPIPPKAPPSACSHPGGASTCCRPYTSGCCGACPATPCPCTSSSSSSLSRSTTTSLKWSSVAFSAGWAFSARLLPVVVMSARC